MRLRTRRVIFTIVGILLVIAYFASRPPIGQTEIAYVFATSSPSSIDWHSDSQRIAIANASAQVFNVTNQQYVYIPDSQGSERVEWNPAGDRLAIAGAEVLVWDHSEAITLATRAEYRQYSDIEWLPDDNLLAVASNGLNRDDGRIWLWDAETLDSRGRIQADTSSRVSDTIGFWSIQSIPSTSYITTTLFSGSNQIWDIATQRNVRGLLLTDTRIVAPDPTGDVLAVVTVGRISLVDVQTGEVMTVLDGNHGTASTIAWNNDGHLLAAIYNSSGELIVWDIDTENIVFRTQIRATERSRYDIDWHPGLNVFVMTSNTETRLWDIDANTSTLIRAGYAHIAQWSPDGTKFAVVSRGGLRIYAFPLSD